MSKETDLALERSGFARRLKDRENGSNSGIFLTAADIERRNPTNISAMFEDLPGVTVCRRGFSAGGPNSTCGLKGTHLIPRTENRRTIFVPCTLTIFVDGIRLNHATEPTKDSTNIDGYVVPADVAGMEYYPSGNRIPAQFQLLNGSCGAVLVWTKRG